MVNSKSMINVCCFSLYLIGSILLIGFLSQAIYNANKLTKTNCSVNEYEDCTYTATADSCDPSIELEFDDGCDHDNKYNQKINETYTCYLEPNGCIDGEFTFETPSDIKINAIGPMFAGIIGFLGCGAMCFIAIRYWDDDKLMLMEAIKMFGSD